jgi:hypothetical protein
MFDMGLFTRKKVIANCPQSDRHFSFGYNATEIQSWLL